MTAGQEAKEKEKFEWIFAQYYPITVKYPDEIAYQAGWRMWLERAKQDREEIERLKEELASCQRELDRARGKSWIEKCVVPE